MHKRLIWLGLIGLVAVGGSVSFRMHGSGSSGQSRLTAAASQDPAEVVRSPAGIDEPARASVADIREMNLLWKDLDALKQQARELGPAEYQSRCVRRTATFLQLVDVAAAQFAKNVDLVLLDFMEARQRMERAQALVAYNPDKRESVMHYRAVWDRYSKDRHAAVGRVASTLPFTPRRQLFAEQSLKWVLRMEQGSEEVSKPDQTKKSGGR
jgi:hypothetical protein